MNPLLFDDILNSIVDNLQISKTDYDSVTRSYDAVAKWLSGENSKLQAYNLEILPQGSFLFGTIIKPISEETDIDIDLVCRLHGKDISWTQSDIKRIVGERLKENETYSKMLDSEGRRCWTIHYSESRNYHMDILPSIVAKDYDILIEKISELSYDEQSAVLGIRITDNTLENYNSETDPEYWPKSNPFGYAKWLNERERTSAHYALLTERKIFPVPQQDENKSILIKSIQLLKRHRDIKYGGDEDKPVSIILTTLAAQAYNGEDDLFTSMLNIVKKMESFIVDKYDHKLKKLIKWVQNPVDSDENYADKWKESTRKQKIFYQWLEELNQDIESAFREKDVQAIFGSLESVFGKQIIKESTKVLGEKLSNRAINRNITMALFDVPHRQKPLWSIIPTGEVKITGRYKVKNGWELSVLGEDIIPKDCSIYFEAETTIEAPFDVYWQVVNTGKEAKDNKGLRGEIFHSKTYGVGGLKQKESSLYKGTHWIECFIVKNNICVARSGEYLVRIE